LRNKAIFQAIVQDVFFRSRNLTNDAAGADTPDGGELYFAEPTPCRPDWRRGPRTC